MPTKKRIFLLWSALIITSAWAPLCLADSTCAPSVSISGDNQAKLKTLLAKRGIQTEDKNCGVTKAKLTETKNGFLLEIEDAQGRKSQHEVSSLEAAATLIESWSRQDLSEPLLFRRFPKKAPEISWNKQDEAIPYAFVQEERPDFSFESKVLNEPSISSLSLSFLGGVGVNSARGTQYNSQLGVAMQRGMFRLGVFSRLSKPNNPNSAQLAKSALNNPSSCTVDTNNDGLIDDSDCIDPSKPGDPCAPNANGSIDPSCINNPNPVCSQDTNGDNIIDVSDCAPTKGSLGYSLGLGADVSMPLAVGSVLLTPGLELGAAYNTNTLVSLRGGLSLTASAQVKEHLALDLRVALDSPLQGATYLWTGLGFHWENEK
jgi:hypothetical protein